MEKQSNGTYKVVGGNLNDGDLNIYIVSGGKRTGEILGKSLFIDSFYNYDAGAGWYGNIDVNSRQGMNFLQGIYDKTPSLIEYTKNASDYNFKDAGKGNLKDADLLNHRYRGSKFSDGVFASARDYGNIAAGYVAGFGGLSYSSTRSIFDAFQAGGNQGVIHGYIHGNGQVDAPNSQRGQSYGWNIGNNAYLAKNGNQYWPNWGLKK